MTETTKISKTLSYWLRHAPQEGGLSLDANGWTNVDALLAALAGKRLPADWETLLAVVETNDKQRFELSPDGGRIRARQGHSVSVEGDWTAATPPEVLWHGTVERFLGSILADGLKPMNRHHVHLSADVETARRVGGRRGRPVILEVAAGRLAARGQAFFVTGNGVWLTAGVPPEALKRI
ncbi:MAG: RNA 2'-phosphotransferase [Caulobacter sp.]